ncbi:uncharacterized protein TM35_000171710 [Trypanosoma theileri]|uniref:Uncharacterized protein n=1 Tax=Trypanosoma theileri TaxID=67003 RepID=A0A1X0NVR1_9TRYP|nr:uncharacterized protein TM35_000171710 [Trypanosoma theileri]ORC88299.1 hypothetical protein TM35_000171710 [Trypanosoma theileri]
MNDPLTRPALGGSGPSSRQHHPPLDLTFDFLAGEEMRPLPVHEVERRRAEERRRKSVAVDVTEQEFAASLGITIEDTRDPITGVSCLDYNNAMKEYYGDPEDDAYMEFMKSLSRVLANQTWLKGNNFLGKDIEGDYTRLKRFEDDALKLVGTSHEKHITTLENHVYSGVQSNAHREFLQQYREETCPDQVLLRLAFEQKRRDCDAASSTAEVTDVANECLSISPPRQRQWKGKQYKKAFLGLCKDENAPHMLE